MTKAKHIHEIKWVSIKELNNWESISYETSTGIKFTALKPKTKYAFKAPDGTVFSAIPVQKQVSKTVHDCGHRYDVSSNIITVPVKVLGAKIEMPITLLRMEAEVFEK